MSRTGIYLLVWLLSATLPAAAAAEQIMSVDPAYTWLDASSGLRDTVTWRIASPGGVKSAAAEFVNLDNNRVLGTIHRPLVLSADAGSLSEELKLDPAKAHRWYSAGVRRLGYRRTFRGAAGTVTNQVVIDLRGSGRLAGLSAAPAEQTLTVNSRQMMLEWTFSTDIGEVNANSASGLFLIGDRVIYANGEPLLNSGREHIREVVAVPPGLVRDLLDSGVHKIRYSRTFIDDKNERRSASVTLKLLR